MTEPKIVVTGAHSYLGRAALAQLMQLTGAQLTGVVTPWAGAQRAGGGGDERVKWIAADLTAPLPDEARVALAQGASVLHLAWVRGRDPRQVEAANLRAIDHLLGAMPDPGRFLFVSSVAASPAAQSVYGKTKYTAMARVRERGGVSLVCGLVVEAHARGPYKMLLDAVRRFPLSLRLAGVSVYPIHLDDVMAGLVQTALCPPPPGDYRLFGEDPPSFNAFMARLEALAPRVRVPCPLPAGLIRAGARCLRATHLAPLSVSDKILTFLYKDDAYLRGHADLPGVRMTPWRKLSQRLGDT